VNVWADTAEVFRCVPLGFGGSLPPQNNQTEQTTPPQEGQESTQTTSTPEGSLTPAIAILLLVFVILFGTLIMYKKWKRF
jgi:hypothetical protein